MGSCTGSSCHNYAWQATLEGILSNFQDEFRIANSTNGLEHHPAAKKLTSEALFMLYVILIFVIITIIGSSIGTIELLCKEFRKEITLLFDIGKSIVSNGTEYSEAKERSFESSTETKSRFMHIYNIKQIGRDGLHLAFKLILQNDIWKSCREYLECFSIQTNGRKMLNTVSGEEQLNCFHGLKTIAMFWVGINHITMFYANSLSTVTTEFKDMLEWPTSQLITNGIFTNDIFFVLSGFSTGYAFFDFYKKRKGKIPWHLYYLSRVLRFTPFYLIVLGFYATLFSYIGSGPIWPTYSTNPLCKENWLWNILYINNFITQKKQCMLATWYIACDLQMYIISPIFLLLLIRRPKIGFSLLLACVFGSCLTSFLLTKHFHLIDGISKLASHAHAMPAFYSRFWVYFDMIYVKPYTRIGSYLIGMALGYFMFQRKYSEVKKNRLVTLCTGWTLSLVFMGISFFAIYNRQESEWERALYNGTKHLLFSFSISWIIFVCVTGQGGLVNWFLSQKLFVLFSRLAYSFYFIHFIVIERYFLSMTELINHSFPSLVLVHLCILGWSLAVSFVVSLVFERPLLNLMGLTLRESKPPKPENKVQ